MGAVELECAEPCHLVGCEKDRSRRSKGGGCQVCSVYRQADFEYTALQEGLLLFHGHVVDSWSINQDLTASSARLSLVADRDPIVEDAGLEFLQPARSAYHHLLSHQRL